MTSPRDALRALTQKWREPMTYVDESMDARAVAFTLRICADELAAILSQMDSDPTVAQGVRSAFVCEAMAGSNSHPCAYPLCACYGHELAAKDKPR